MFRLILLLSLILIVNYVSGHLQTFGQAGRHVNIEEIENDYPNLQRLLKYYIPKSEGFVVRQVLNRDLHFNIWKNDDQLENEVEHLSQTNVYVESIEQNQRLQMKFVDFIDRYQRERLILVDNLPEVLRKYLIVPRPLQCDVFLLALQSIFMIMNDAHSSPLIFNDGNDPLICLYRGNKQLVLVNTNQYPDVRQYVVPNKRQPRKSINPERVDLNQFPSLSNIDYYHVNLTAGDCIFIPNGWVFHERSTESSIAILYNIEHQQVANVNLNAIESCSEYDSSLTFDQIDLPNGNNEPASLRDVMVNLINSNSNTFDKWQQTFSKHLSFDLNSDSDTAAIFDEFYGIIDVDGDGEITLTEVEQINGVHQHHISDLLYEMVKVVGDKQSLKTEHDEHTKTEL